MVDAVWHISQYQGSFWYCKEKIKANDKFAKCKIAAAFYSYVQLIIMLCGVCVTGFL